MSTILLEHFDEAVNSPEDIEMVKKLVLKFAMQGRLIGQNPSDEPASELLKRYWDDKQVLISQKKIITLPGVPYQLPETWEWVSLGEVIELYSGRDIPTNQCNEKGKGIPYIMGASNIHNDELIIERWIEKPVVISEKGDLLLSVKGTVGKIIIQPIEYAHLSRQIMGLRPHPLLSVVFLKRFMEFYVDELKNKSRGLIPGISREDVLNMMLPLPPLNEQIRIIDRIDKLFEQCDQLLHVLVKKQTTSELLNNSIFTKLQDHNNPQQINDLRFVIENIQHLCDNKESIAQIRDSIVSLAVQGKLVEQNEDYEPVNKLVEKIIKEKERLIAEKEIKREKILLPITEDEIPYELPKGWKWLRFVDISIKITDGTHHSPPNGSEGDFIYVTAKNIKPDGVKLDNVTYVKESVHNEIFSRCNPEYGDILYIKDGATTGIATINNLKEPFSMLSSVALLKTPGEINNRYLVYWLNSPVARDMYLSKMSGSAITRLTLSKIKNFIVPIPPFKEQSKIVEVVDNLMNTCDLLERAVCETEINRKRILPSFLAN